LLPEVQVRARRLIKAAAEAGLTLRVTSAYRTWQEQDKLYRQGRSAPGRIVTKLRGGQSWHNFRRAFDVVIMRNGVPQWAANYVVVGRIGEQLGLEWGGRWRGFPDVYHFQLTGGLTIKQVRSAWLRAKDRGVLNEADRTAQELVAKLEDSKYGRAPKD